MEECTNSIFYCCCYCKPSRGYTKSSRYEPCQLTCQLEEWRLKSDAMAINGIQIMSAGSYWCIEKWWQTIRSMQDYSKQILLVQLTSSVHICAASLCRGNKNNVLLMRACVYAQMYGICARCLRAQRLVIPSVTVLLSVCLLDPMDIMACLGLVGLRYYRLVNEIKCRDPWISCTMTTAARTPRYI